MSHHVSFPVFSPCEKGAVGGCSVMGMNHLFGTHFPALRRHRLWGSRSTGTGLCSHGAPQAAVWEKRFPGSPVSPPLCSRCAVLHGRSPPQLDVTPVLLWLAVVRSYHCFLLDVSTHSLWLCDGGQHRLSRDIHSFGR